MKISNNIQSHIYLLTINLLFIIEMKILKYKIDIDYLFHLNTMEYF